jgi:transposase-like protein
MEHKRYGREFKLEAVKLVTDRGVRAVQAARDLGIHANVLREWVRALRRIRSRLFRVTSDEAGASGDRAAAARSGQA